MSQSSQLFADPEQRAQALVETYREQVERLRAKSRRLCEMLCARERSDGSVVIDFVGLAQKLTTEKALELRAAIDEVHHISGAPGEKPRIRLPIPERPEA